MATWLLAPEPVRSAIARETMRGLLAFTPAEMPDARWCEVEADMACGGSLIMVGNECLPRLRHLWVDSLPCGAVAHRDSSHSCLPVGATAWRSAACRSLMVRPDRLHVYFGVDEMPRAEVVPLLEAIDDNGIPVAYSAVWIRHTAASLAGGRFDGANLYLYAFDDPLAAADAVDWSRAIDALAHHACATVALTRVRTHYALYQPGEQVAARIGVANRSGRIAAVRLDLALHAPDGAVAATRSIRRCVDAAERVEVLWEFPCGQEAGLWRVAAALNHEDRFLYGQRRESESTLVERAEGGFVTATGWRTDARLSAPALDNRSFAVAGADGFLAGTHYYPSSSWWDWAWRDFRPERAAADIAEMVRHGYCFARVWIDPELDEDALRGIEAWLHLSGAQGIVSIVCVFTQWSRTLSYPDAGATVSFDFATTDDFNVYSIQLLNVEHQQRYLGVLARRWAHLPNVIWNLANEAYVVDPSPDQIDAAHFGDVEPRSGPLAGAAYFNRWADLMTEALRAEGALQPVLRGYGFVNGGDCYLQNRQGAMLLWHHYERAERAGPCLAFASPGTLAKPLILEEFGIPTLDEDERLERYESIACWSVAMGAAGACAYEWGVSWLTPELPFTATPLKDSSLAANADPRWMEGSVAYAASWPIGSMGLCPWAASFSYGSNQPCTPFAGPAAAALGSVARFCREIGPPHGEEPVLLVVSMEWEGFAPLRGYMRVLDPTIATIQALAAAHVPFSVIQQDQLAGYSGRPAAVLFPTALSVEEGVSEQLDRLASVGARVMTGDAALLSDTLAAYRMGIESDRSVWAIRRRTRDGRMYMLYSPDGPADVLLRDGVSATRVRLRRYALVEMLDTGEHRHWIGGARGREGGETR